MSDCDVSKAAEFTDEDYLHHRMTVLEDQLEWLLSKVDIRFDSLTGIYVSMPCGRGTTDPEKSKNNFKLRGTEKCLK